MAKTVKFGSRNFYTILDHLYLSDQIISFDESLIKKHNITYLINCTKKAPFLLTTTNNIRLHFLHNLHDYSEYKLCKKINKLVDSMNKIIKEKQNILVYCENGIDKSLPIVFCYLMKYSKYTMEQTIDFLNKKIGFKYVTDLTLCKIYKNFLIQNDWHRNNGSSTSSTSSNTSSTLSEEKEEKVENRFIGFIKKHLVHRI